MHYCERKLWIMNSTLSRFTQTYILLFLIIDEYNENVKVNDNDDSNTNDNNMTIANDNAETDSPTTENSSTCEKKKSEGEVEEGAYCFEPFFFTNPRHVNRMTPCDFGILAAVRLLMLRQQSAVRECKFASLVGDITTFLETTLPRYVQLNRAAHNNAGKRNSKEGACASIHTLFFVVFALTHLCFPFFPLMSEHLALGLSRWIDAEKGVGAETTENGKEGGDKVIEREKAREEDERRIRFGHRFVTKSSNNTKQQHVAVKSPNDDARYSLYGVWDSNCLHLLQSIVNSIKEWRRGELDQSFATFQTALNLFTDNVHDHAEKSEEESIVLNCNYFTTRLDWTLLDFDATTFKFGTLRIREFSFCLFCVEVFCFVVSLFVLFVFFVNLLFLRF
jgi:hypothetical protein